MRWLSLLACGLGFAACSADPPLASNVGGMPAITGGAGGPAASAGGTGGTSPQADGGASGGSGPIGAGGAGGGSTGGTTGSGGAEAQPDAGAVIDAGSDAAAADPAGVRFVGRIDRSNPAGPRFAWSGTTILARFTGASVGVRLGGGTNYFDVRIDGMLQPVLVTSAAKQDYALASNLGPGPHELSVFRRTEAREGVTTFLGVSLAPGGALLPPPPAPMRRLEILGDSTTCGYGVDGKSAGCPFTPATENYDVSYGAVAARALGADLVTVAWSAKGMYRNFAGDMKDTMAALYGRTLPDPASTWDFTTWIPDALVINLGSNDFQQGDPGPGFVTAYTDFIHRARKNYPGALIVCAVGPKLSGTQLAGARRYVMAIVSAMNAAGDTRVSFLELPQPQAGDGAGCGGHASVATHKRMGDTLVAELKAKLGW